MVDSNIINGKIDEVEFKIIIVDNKYFIDLDDINLLYKYNNNLSAIMKMMTELTKYEFENDNLSIVLNNKTHYELNAVLLSGITYEKGDISLKLYEYIKKINLDNNIYNYIKYMLNSIKLKQINSTTEILDNYQDLFSSFIKENNAYNYTYYKHFPSTFDFYDLIRQIDEKYHLPDDYFVEKTPAILYDIFEEIEHEIEDDSISIEESAVRMLYILIKKKTFTSHNIECACIFTIHYLNENGYLLTDNKLNISPFDLLYVAAYIENSRKSKESIFNNLKIYFTKSNYNFLTNADKYYKEFNENKSFENAINYIVAFIEQYSNCQTYYDYFSCSNHVKKLHYGGKYYNFKLNIAKTLKEKDTLYFDAFAIAKIENPIGIKNRSDFINTLVAEIEKRSYKDVIVNKLLKELKDNLKNHFAFDKIKIEFNFTWHISIEDED